MTVKSPFASSRTDLPDSLAQIARKVGVSTATISRVLNNSPRVKPHTRHKVLKAINETRFAIRKSPATNTLGISFFDFHSNILNNLFCRDCLAGIAESVHQHGLNLHVIDLLSEKQRGETYPQMLHRLGLAGIIHVAFFQSALEAILEIAETGFPQFILCGRLNHPRIHWLDSENVASTQKAVKYLVNLGHQRIAAMTASRNSPDQNERFEGYLSAMTEAGIEPDKELIVERIDITLDAGMSATLELLTKSNPQTAVFYGNGELAIGGIKACRKLGLRIPEDVSIVAFADSRLPEFMVPALTYIHQPVFEMGRRAGQCLAGQIKHQETRILQEVIIPDFFINESTGPCGKNL